MSKARGHLLLVEDNQGVREGVSEFLRLEGYRVDTFVSGSRAMEYLESHPAPDLILLDLLLTPDMNGWQFAELVKRDPVLRQIPIVALSGATLDREQLRQCKVEEFLAKPFSFDKLLSLVERYSGEREPPLQ